jgi:hypothetical protein
MGTWPTVRLVALVAGVLVTAGCSGNDGDGTGGPAESAPAASVTPAPSPTPSGFELPAGEELRAFLEGTWTPTILSQTGPYFLTVDENGEVTTLGSPGGSSTDLCGGSLTGEEELMLELSCVDMEELGPGAAPEPGSYEAEVVVAPAVLYSSQSTGYVLVVRWSDGATDYLEKHES